MLGWLIRRFRWALLFAALGSAASGACSVVLLAQLNAALTTPRSRSISGAVAFFAVALVVTASGSIAKILFERLRHRALADLRESLCAQVQQAPYRQLEEVGAATVQSALAEHVGSIALFVVNIPVLLTNAAIVVAALLYLAVLSPLVLLITLLVIGLGSLGYHLANLRAIRFLRGGALEQERLFGHFASLSAGAKELRLNGLKRAMFSKEILRRSIESVRRQRTMGASLFVAASASGSFLLYVFLGLVLFVIVGDEPDRARITTGFALVILYLVSPLEALLLAIPSAGVARVAFERVTDLTRRLHSTEVACSGAPFEPFQRVVLAGVTHRYYHEQSNEMFALGPVDLVLLPGQVTFLVGGNGSGKTTLAKLIVGLYPPEEGQLLLNGAPIRDDHRDAYRQRFSAIFSDFHLFEQLLDPRGGALDERGNELLASLHLQHKVQLRDGAFTTAALSQGQRKRLALVAACLEDRPVLVFDEWAADQDPAFKNVFYHEVLRDLRQQGKAVLVISHDDRYFHLADQLVRLENGRIVAVEHAGARLPAQNCERMVSMTLRGAP